MSGFGFMPPPIISAASPEGLEPQRQQPQTARQSFQSSPCIPRGQKFKISSSGSPPLHPRVFVNRAPFWSAWEHSDLLLLLLSPWPASSTHSARRCLRMSCQWWKKIWRLTFSSGSVSYVAQKCSPQHFAAAAAVSSCQPCMTHTSCVSPAALLSTAAASLYAGLFRRPSLTLLPPPAIAQAFEDNAATDCRRLPRALRLNRCVQRTCRAYKQQR